MEFAKTGYRWKERPDLSVNSLMVLHAGGSNWGDHPHKTYKSNVFYHDFTIRKDTWLPNISEIAPHKLTDWIHPGSTPCGESARSQWNWQVPPTAPVSSVLPENIGTKRQLLYQSQSPLGLGRRRDRGSRTVCPNMAHSSCDGHVGYIIWPRITGSCKIAFSQADNQACSAV